MIPTGAYRWEFEAGSLPKSGAYLVRLITESGQLSQILVRQ